MLTYFFEKTEEHKFLILLWLTGAILYGYFFGNSARVNLNIDVQKKTVFRMYWAAENQDFSEKRTERLIVTPKKKNYSFTLTDVRKINRLRLDPHQYIGTSRIHQLDLIQNGLKPIQYKAKELFQRFKPANQIETYTVNNTSVEINSNGGDPFLIGELSFEKTSYPWLQESARYLFLCLVITLIYLTIKQSTLRKLNHIPVLMVVVLLLVLVMAVISKRNVHPDEFVHIYASQYYQDHWMPPEIDDPAIRHTYSPYGTSRLNNSEISYLFAGKFGQLISFLNVKPYWLFRFFNIFLFGCILLYVIKNSTVRPVAVPLLISPQIWYVFSYSNSDAFALFVTFLVSAQLVAPDSIFNRFIKQRQSRYTLVYGVLLGCLLGCLFLLKKNYYPFIAFVLTFIAWQIWQSQERVERILMLKRLLVLTVIGISIFGLRKGADYYVNGLDKGEKLAKIRVETARTLYNPKTELSKTHPGLYLKKKGIPLSYVVETKRFFEQTFRSAFGVYGYFTISAPFNYYDAVRWVGTILLLLLIGKTLFFSWRENGLLVFSFLFFATLLIYFSLNHSWTKDLQAQGRYLFPIIPMLSIIYAKSQQYVRDRLFSLCFMTLFLLSCYSFLFVALLRIPKAL